MTGPSDHVPRDEGWPEARGPHLPDRLTSIPRPVWPFVALAVIGAIAYWSATRGAEADTVMWTVLGAVGEVSMTLLGAALFLRHPGAVRSMPLLVLGVSLIAAEQAMRLFRSPLQPVFDAVTTGTDGDLTGSMIASSAFLQVASIVGLLGLLCLARGLAAARRFEGGASRLVLVVLVALSVVSVGFGTSLVLRLPSDEVVGGLPSYLAAAAIGLGVSMATSYLAAVAFGGWRGGEEPSAAWLLVALWGMVTIGVNALVTFTSVVIGLEQDLSWAFVLSVTAAGLAMLGAFALGLPSVDPLASSSSESAGRDAV